MVASAAALCLQLIVAIHQVADRARETRAQRYCQKTHGRDDWGGSEESAEEIDGKHIGKDVSNVQVGEGRCD